MGRHCSFDGVDVDEHVPNQLGQIPSLEYHELVVNPKV
jgi:hypothetical protein